MKTTSTQALTGLALRRAVAAAVGQEVRKIDDHLCCVNDEGLTCGRWAPDIDWAQGGPIIEGEKITVKAQPPFAQAKGDWHANAWATTHEAYGPTPLIAAMRCFIASRLGEAVDVPKERP